MSRVNLTNFARARAIPAASPHTHSIPALASSAHPSLEHQQPAPEVARRARSRARRAERGERMDTVREPSHSGYQRPPRSPRLASQSRAPSARVPTELLASGTYLNAAAHTRGFHTSAAARMSNDKTSTEDRKKIRTSSWSRPPRPSQDARDDVVPTYYVERKKQRDQISQRKEEEGGLMAELNAGILSEGLAAKTRVREEKIPVEVRLADGSVAHPSGFQPPTPETEFHPVAAKVPTEDHPLVATIKQPWDEREFPVVGADPINPDPEQEQEWLKRVATSGSTVLTGVRDINADKPAAGSSAKAATSPADRSKITTSAWDKPSRSQDPNDPDSVVPSFYIERKRQRDDIAERKEEEGGLMAELNAGILSEDLAASTREREEKIPVEVYLKDGTIAHPSGFVPPTLETEFHPVAAKPPDSPKLPWTEIDAVRDGVPSSAVEAAAAAVKKPSNARGLHTSAVARAGILFNSPPFWHALVGARDGKAQEAEKLSDELDVD